MTEGYSDPEFPEMEGLPEDWDMDLNECEGASGDEVVGSQEEVQELLQEQPQEQPEVSGYLQRESLQTVNQDSGEVLFLPEDDPIQQPLISEPLDPRLVYTRFVPRRLRHLVSERRQPEYHKPAGLYRPGG